VNVLVDQFPTAVQIDGSEYEIETDYRSCLRVILAFEDAALTDLEKQMVLLANMYPGSTPPDVRQAIEQATRFLNGGKEADGEEAGTPRLYSFGQDASFIFAAFRQTHGIDLETEQMHWWKFLALFLDLGADTTFCKVVSLRKRVKTGTATKEEKRLAREMGAVFDIPEIDTRTPEEKERETEFLRLVQEGERSRGRAGS